MCNILHKIYKNTIIQSPLTRSMTVLNGTFVMQYFCDWEQYCNSLRLSLTAQTTIKQLMGRPTHLTLVANRFTYRHRSSIAVKIEQKKFGFWDSAPRPRSSRPTSWLGGAGRHLPKNLSRLGIRPRLSALRASHFDPSGLVNLMHIK